MINHVTRKLGFGFDFWVYVVRQKCENKIHDKECCNFGKLMYRRAEYSEPNSFASPICDSDGMYYNVFSSQDEEVGTIFIKETGKGGHYFSVPWLNEKEIQDIRTISIDPEYQKDLSPLLMDFIHQSPVRKMYLQIRCQGLENNNLIGILTVEQISKLMEKDQLLGNMVYVIHNP